MGRVSGKTVLITGGASGIGLASAELLAAEGARVLVVDRNAGAVEAVSKRFNGEVVGLVADVSDLDALDRLYEQVRVHTDRLDVVFANAGVAELAPMGSISEAMYDRLFDINVKGILFTVQKALPLIPDGGSIILTSSVAQLMGAAAFGTYAATKAAVRSFARSWTTDLKHRGIRVNAISPGHTYTPMADHLGFDDKILKALAADVPLGRLGRPSETAAAVLFLASDESSFVTGIDLCVDGGLAQV